MASWITPRLGGVGPTTVAMLLRNTVEAAERSISWSGRLPPGSGVWYLLYAPSTWVGRGPLSCIMGNARACWPSAGNDVTAG